MSVADPQGLHKLKTIDQLRDGEAAEEGSTRQKTTKLAYRRRWTVFKGYSALFPIVWGYNHPVGRATVFYENYKGISLTNITASTLRTIASLDSIKGFTEVAEATLAEYFHYV